MKTMSLANLPATLGLGKWLEYQRPFRHFRAFNVFTDDVYVALERNFLSLLSGECDARPGFAKTDSRYDALMLGVQSSIAPLFFPLFTREWHDLITHLVGVRATGYVDGGLHHHPIGSADGWIHNDLCQGWFPESNPTDGVVLSDHELCDYRTGEPLSAEVKPLCLVRSVALIFFLANCKWAPGAGGETGLYSTPYDEISQPDAVVEPENNSLVLFECSPHSYHCYLQNHYSERNSIVLWAHSTPEIAAMKYGRFCIQGWT